MYCKTYLNQQLQLVFYTSDLNNTSEILKHYAQQKLSQIKELNYLFPNHFSLLFKKIRDKVQLSFSGILSGSSTPYLDVLTNNLFSTEKKLLEACVFLLNCSIFLGLISRSQQRTLRFLFLFFPLKC